MLVLTEVLNIFFNDFDAEKSVRCYQEFSPNSEMGPSVFLEAIFKKVTMKLDNTRKQYKQKLTWH